MGIEIRSWASAGTSKYPWAKKKKEKKKEKTNMHWTIYYNITFYPKS